MHYEKPALQRFGTLRDLTLLGATGNGDGGLWGIGWQTQSFPSDVNPGRS